MYLFTLPQRQNMGQGRFWSRLKQICIYGFSTPRPVALPSIKNTVRPIIFQNLGQNKWIHEEIYRKFYAGFDFGSVILFTRAITACLYSKVSLHIYIVIHRQTVSFYQNSSMWLDTLDARSRDRKPSTFTLDCVSYLSATKRTTLAKGILRYLI